MTLANEAQAVVEVVHALEPLTPARRVSVIRAALALLPCDDIPVLPKPVLPKAPESRKRRTLRRPSWLAFPVWKKSGRGKMEKKCPSCRRTIYVGYRKKACPACQEPL